MKNLIIIAISIIIAGCNTSDPREKTDISNHAKMESMEMEKNKERVKAFFKLLEEENIEQFVAMFAKEGVQVNPYASGLFPQGAKGHQELTRYWKPVPGNFDGMEFKIEELLGTEDPNKVFVKYQGKIKLKNNSGHYQNQYYSTFTFDADGKILEYVEIFNPIVAAQAFGLTDSIK